MTTTVQELFGNIRRCLDEIEQTLESQNKNTLAESLQNFRIQCLLLHQEVEREITLSRIERDLYSSPKSLGKTLDHIKNIIQTQFSFSRFDIVIMDHELKRVLRRYSKGGFGEEDFKILNKYGALAVTRNYCLNNKEPWIVNDVMTQDPNWKVARELDVRAHGTFPLYLKKNNAHEELVGFLHGAWSEEDVQKGKYFSPSILEELNKLGLAITNAIREAKLSYFENAVMKIQHVIGSTRIETPRTIEEIVTKEDDTGNSMEQVISTIIHTLGADCGGILLTDKTGIIPCIFKTHDGKEIDPQSVLIDSRNGIINSVLLQGQSVIENENTRNSEKLDIHIGEYPETIHTLLAVPLIEPYTEAGKVRKNIIGCIVLINQHDENKNIIKTDFPGNEGGFSTVDRRIIETISPHIETILSNTRSYGELRRLSLTDGLTGLANHSHFLNNILTLEFQRSQRYGTPLSILLMDIDHFKVFNDIFGHQVGDLVLKEAARILSENTRSVDHIARYGGEEFSVLLHNTNLKDALAYSEKIRSCISSGAYIEKIRENELFSIEEAQKRFRAIMELTDEKVREAKLAVMQRHFNLNIKEVQKLIEEGHTEQAEKRIFESFKVTLSIGLAFYPNSGISTKKDFLVSADMLLLQAKERGRNRVEAIEI